jgi:hypothetical protein
MFLFVSRSAKAFVAAIAISAGALAAPAFASKPAPSKAQIRAAVNKAEHSRYLWATVNICNTKHHRDMIGVRGQMPSLSFAVSLDMNIQIDYWSSTRHRFVRVPGVAKSVPLGDPTNSIVQGGATFRFDPPVYLSGTISFKWKLHGKVIGRTSRATSSGDKHVAFGDPPGYSAATCRMSKPAKA